MRISVSILGWKFILAMLFISVCFYLSSCTNKEAGGEAADEETEEISPAEMDVQVKTAKVEVGEMPVMVKAVGVLLPAMQSPAIVVPLTPGIVSKVEVTEGQPVEAGAIIIRLELVLHSRAA